MHTIENRDLIAALENFGLIDRVIVEIPKTAEKDYAEASKAFGEIEEGFEQLEIITENHTLTPATKRIRTDEQIAKIKAATEKFAPLWEGIYNQDNDYELNILGVERKGNQAVIVAE